MVELASIIEHYYDAYMNKYGNTALPSHKKALNAIRSCRTPAPVNFMCSALIVITVNGDRYPVVTGVVRSVRTMKPVSGLIANRASYYL